MELGAEATATGLGRLHSTSEWRQIEKDFLATGDPLEVQSRLTQAVDAIAISAYTSVIQPLLSESAAMLALGGFGRRELFPYSDVSILILLETESPWISLRDVLSETVRQLWDAGLRVNHAVRTIAECLDAREDNLDLRIGLLDQRFLAGDQRVHSQLENRLPAFISKNGGKLAQHLREQARIRHARFQNTIRHSQPNVKDSPGGLRDVSLVRWLNKLASERPVDEADSFLSAARCYLHYRAHADRNIFDFEAQQAIESQPFAAGTSRTQWMREYYLRAGLVFSEARRELDTIGKGESSLLENFLEWRTRLSNSDFTVSRDRVLLRNPAQIESDPGLVMRMLEFIARHDIAPSSDTERRLQAVKPLLAAHCAAPAPLWPILKSIFALPHSALALRTLEGTGLMTAVFPEWAHIENLVVADSDYRYTADEHSLIAIERANELRSPSADSSRQRFSQLLSEIDNPALLMFAILYHDIARDAESGQVVQAAASRAREAAVRIEMPGDERSEVEFLIQHQNDLADAMSGRDADDPATARFLAERTGTIERLKLLTALTYADLSAIGSDPVSAWRLEQLWRVYEITRQELTRELETDRIRDVPRAVPGQAEFIKGLPVRYLRAHSPAEIEAHLQLFEFSRPTGVAVDLRRIQGAYRLTVIARDMPFLFASFAGALSSFGLDILKAEAFSNAKGLILDTFVFADPKRTLELNPPEVERLQDLIRRVALGKTDGQRLLRKRGQVDPKKRGMAPQIQFDSEACETATLVEIIAEDRPGLLYSLATVFSSTACNIDVVLIDTKGHRAIDVFYVAHDGRKLSQEMQAMLKEKLLAAC